MVVVLWEVAIIPITDYGMEFGVKLTATVAVMSDCHAWFFCQFPVAQEENIEVRLCHDEPFSNEGVLLDQLQLFVQ